MNALLEIPPDILRRVGTREAIGIRQGPASRFVVWRCACGNSGSMRLATWQRAESLRCDRCSKPKHRMRVAAAERAEQQSPIAGEYFRCGKLALTLRRGSCANNWRQFTKRPGRVEGRIGCACTRCPIGEVHAAGKRHADAPIVQLVAKPSDKPRKTRRCHCGAALPVGRYSTCSPECGNQRKAFEALAHSIEMVEQYG